MHVAPTRQLPVVRLYKGSAPADLPEINSIHFRVAAKVGTNSSTNRLNQRHAHSACASPSCSRCYSQLNHLIFSEIRGPADQGPRKLLRLLRMIFSLSVLMDFCEWPRLDVTSTPQKSSTAQLDKSTHTRHTEMDAEKVV